MDHVPALEYRWNHGTEDVDDATTASPLAVRPMLVIGLANGVGVLDGATQLLLL
jgi:hypothetical protein